jgi:hypothetical protein
MKVAEAPNGIAAMSKVPIEGWLQIGLFLGHREGKFFRLIRSVLRGTSRATASLASARTSSSASRRPRSRIRRCAGRSCLPKSRTAVWRWSPSCDALRERHGGLHEPRDGAPVRSLRLGARRDHADQALRPAGPRKAPPARRTSAAGVRRRSRTAAWRSGPAWASSRRHGPSSTTRMPSAPSRSTASRISLGLSRRSRHPHLSSKGCARPDHAHA